MTGPRRPANRILCLVVLAAIAAATGGPAAGTEPAVALKRLPPVAGHIAALPRLVAAPGNATAKRINQALDKGDGRVKAAARDCFKGKDPKRVDWERSVAVPMRGPHYLSLTVTDYVDCSGAHPDTDVQALVYDLSTGTPVNWTGLLPKTLVQGTSTDKAGDGTTLGLVSSNDLTKLYLAAAKLDGIDPGCKDAMADTSFNFLLWPDAEHDGLGVQPFGLPHAIAACGPGVTLSSASLRKLGVQPALLDAVAAAHAAGLFGVGK